MGENLVGFQYHPRVFTGPDDRESQARQYHDEQHREFEQSAQQCTPAGIIYTACTEYPLRNVLIGDPEIESQDGYANEGAQPRQFGVRNRMVCGVEYGEFGGVANAFGQRRP